MWIDENEIFGEDDANAIVAIVFEYRYARKTRFEYFRQGRCVQTIRSGESEYFVDRGHDLHHLMVHGGVGQG